MTNQEFLPKDPTKALVEVKEKLYQRWSENKDTLESVKDFDNYDVWNFAIKAIKNENKFLENLIDMIERS